MQSSHVRFAVAEPGSSISEPTAQSAQSTQRLAALASSSYCSFIHGIGAAVPPSHYVPTPRVVQTGGIVSVAGVVSTVPAAHVPTAAHELELGCEV